MGKFEKPLTWILLIGLLGYLFAENCCKTECSTEVKKEIRVEIQVEDENLNIDSMVDSVIENIDLESDVDTVIEINIDLTEDKETESTSYFESADEMPEFSGGMSGLMQFITDNVTYPEKAKEANITGKVYTQYIVEKDGSVSNVNVIRGIDELLDNEAARVIASLPNYETSGITDGKKVRVKMTMPINFTLN